MGKAMEHHDEELYLVGGDWNHGMDYDFPETVGNGKSSQLLLTPSFFRGVGRKTTNQPKFAPSAHKHHD